MALTMAVEPMARMAARVDGWVDRLVAPLSRVLGSYFTVLPEHMTLVFWSVVFFFGLSAIVRLAVAPWLIAVAERRGTVVAEGTRKKWGHTVVSMVHAIVATTWTLYLLTSGRLRRADTVDARVFGYDPAIGQLLAFVAAYFVWDATICVRNVRVYGRGFLVHAFLGLLAVLSCFKPFLMYITARFVLFEASTIFMNMHWVLEKLGHARTAWYMVANDSIFLVVFTGVRLGYGSYLSWRCYQDIIAVWDRSPFFCLAVSSLANVTTHVLNIYWFFKLVRNLMRTILHAKRD